MKIRSYLAILLAITLVCGLGTDIINARQYKSLNNATAKYTQALLYQKDLNRIMADGKQYLISTDLILASGQSYLALGTLEKGASIIQELDMLQKSKGSSWRDNLIEKLQKDIYIIQSFIERSTTISHKLDRAGMLNEILADYDPVAQQVISDYQAIEMESAAHVENLLNTIETLENDLRITSSLLYVAFFLIICASWLWANRKICDPIRDLMKDALKIHYRGDFEGINYGPQEVVELSDNFKAIADSLAYAANRDPLTQIFNRRAFERKIATLGKQDNQTTKQHILCVIDLDRFKAVNDNCGHAAGDALLKQVAGILEKHSRRNDIVARLGGDEFVLLIFDATIDQGKSVCERIRKEINNLKFEQNEQIFYIGASIGLTEVSPNSQSVEDAMHAADMACLLAKETGRNSVHVSDSHEELLGKKRRETLEINKIRNAINSGKFELFKQDIVPSDPSETGEHFEILIRLRDENGGYISPDQFIPLVESHQLGPYVDSWVVDNAIDWIKNNPKLYSSLRCCSINLSGQSLVSAKFRQFVLHKLDQDKSLAEKICFEITETAAFNDVDTANSLIAELKGLGCQFALDDFGSGLSSFAYLRNLDVDFIKIDGLFVKEMLSRPSDYATVEAISKVAKSLGKQTIAEYVETAAIATALKRLDIDYLQGYHYSKPEPISQAEEFRLLA